MSRMASTEDEELAQRIVQTILRASVSRYDYNRGQSVPDLRIDYKDGHVGFVEVVADWSPAYRAMDAMLHGGNDELVIAGMRYDWWIWPAVNAPIKRLRQELPLLLGELEKAGLTFDHRCDATLRARMAASPFAPEFDKLRIERIVAGPRATDGGVARLVLPGVSGDAAIHIDRIASWVGEFVERSTDVPRKLAETGAEERHAFIVVTLTSEWDVFHALTMDGYSHLPSVDPVLPDEVTHVWLLNTSGDRCIAWFPEKGWFDYAAVMNNERSTTQRQPRPVCTSADDGITAPGSI